MLEDSDFRVRNHAAIAISDYIKKSQAIVDGDTRKFTTKQELLIKYVGERVFRQMPYPMCHVKDMQLQTNDAIQAHTSAVLGRILYQLTNSLLDLSNKDKQVLNVWTSFCLAFD